MLALMRSMHVHNKIIPVRIQTQEFSKLTLIQYEQYRRDTHLGTTVVNTDIVNFQAS
jgi:hypothetical protein